MKKIIILFIMLFAINAYAFDGKVQGSFYDTDVYMYGNNISVDTPKFSGSIEIGHRIKRVRGFCEVKTFIDNYNGNGTFHPMAVEYTAGLSADLHENIEVEFKHVCFHPIDTGGLSYDNNIITVTWHFGEEHKNPIK